MKTPKAIEVIQEYQKWLKEPPELTENGICTDTMPDAVELDKALSKAVEVMEQSVEGAKLPLTSDRLEAYGFKLVGGFLDVYSLDVFRFGRINIYLNLGTDKTVVELANKNGYVFGKPKIKYVHQLRNLYYCLTGKEFEVTND